MPATVWVDDLYAAYTTDTTEDPDYYYGSVVPYLGDLFEIIWDDTNIQPPPPKAIRPPNGTPPSPPRVKRVRVPGPVY